MAYASGKFASALCDRCGFKYKLLDLKKEWNGLKTCHTCFEPKHPQLEPIRAPSDPEALYNPRPSTDEGIGEGFVFINNSNIFKGNNMNPSIVGQNFIISKMTASVGAVTITT
tara:strand:- start:113 stop:451 length:339 start_codon:yes stop_codon:yes gene_type:complete